MAWLKLSIKTVAVLLVLNTPPVTIASPVTNSEEELYFKIFGKKKEAIQTLTMPMYINKREFSEIQLEIDNTKNTKKLKKEAALHVLATYLEADIYQELINKLGSTKHIELTWFSENAMPADYDAGKLRLDITIPAHIRKIEFIDLQSIRQSQSKKSISPATVSGYINLYADYRYKWSGSTPSEKEQKFAFNSALNINNWVLDAEFFHNQNGEKDWTRGDIAVVHDRLEDSVRLRIGDSILPVTGFQQGPPIGGLVVSKNFDIQPEYDAKPSHQKQFVLKYHSTVIIEINGRQYKVLRLPAGRYDLQNFPLASGINDITLRIIDDFGRERTLHFPLFYYSALLKQGVHEYSYAVGAPKLSSDNEYASDYIVSGYHRVGISNEMSLGANLQFNKTTRLFGGEYHVSGGYGNLSLQPAISQDDSYGVGYALALDYWYKSTEGASHNNPVWELSVDAWSKRFQVPGKLTAQAIKLDLLAGVSIPLNENIYMAIRQRYLLTHDNEQQYNTNLFFRQQLTSDLSFDTAVNYQFGDNTKGETFVTANLNYTFGNRRQNVRASYDNNQNSKQLTYSYRPKTYIDRPEVELDIKDNNTNTISSGEIKYRTNRFDNTVRHFHTYDPRLTDNTNSTTEYTLATSLVYADGTFALSRPVRDSFAIISTPTALNDVELIVDGREENYAAKSDYLGPAVITDLVSYYTRTVDIDIPKLPVGYDMGSGYVNFKPSYHSGTRIDYGSAAQVLLRSQLVNLSQQPVGLKAGRIESLNRKESIEKMFFTNRQGNFQIDGLAPGKYRLFLLQHPEQAVEITIPEDAQGVYQANIINLSV